VYCCSTSKKLSFSQKKCYSSHYSIRAEGTQISRSILCRTRSGYIEAITIHNLNNVPHHKRGYCILHSRYLIVTFCDNIFTLLLYLGASDLMIVEKLNLFYHLACFVCARCGMQLSDGQNETAVSRLLSNGQIMCSQV
ncbi:unnamed protein product, partial [Schistocephalus solidus]|uniref:LIM zinc-binding domain-containing protein n=1 Tax=Schistocephalus solidus TaxID=70667 RepID=A0A183SNP5_SCHSO